MENPEIDPYKYKQLTSDKGANQYNGAKIIFSINGAGTIRHVKDESRSWTHYFSQNIPLYPSQKIPQMDQTYMLKEKV